MKKGVILGLLVLLIVVPVFAGGEQEAAPAAGGGEKEEVVEQKTVNFFISGKSVWGEPMEDVVARFNEDYPNITVEYEVVGGGVDWRPVLATRARTGNLPDIFMIDGASDFATYGEYLDDLSDMEVVDHFLPVAKESAYLDGRLMGLPTSIEGYGYIYNKDLFAEAGIAKVPETFSELEAAVKKLAAAGITPFVSGYGTWWVTANHQLNVPFASQDDPWGFVESLNAGTGSIAENEYFQALQKLIDLVRSNTMGDPLSQDHHMQVSLFASEDAAMIQQGNWKEAAILGANPDIDMGLVPLALTENAARSGRIPVGIPWYFVVTEDSEVNKEARTFLNWLLNEPAGQQELAVTLNSIPAYDHFDVDFAGGISSDILAYSLEGKTMPWIFGLWPQGYAQEAANILQEYIADRISFDEALRRLDKSWQDLAK
jgi:raffinose/stachyose/melibiose transport system substrate-binding protein